MLWDDAMEAARPKLREETAAFLASLPFRPADLDSLPVEEWVARQRADQLGGPPSDRAKDRTIAGPAGPLRLRTFVPDKVAGVMLHIHGGGWVAGSPEIDRPSARDPHGHVQHRRGQRRLPTRA